MDIFTDQWSICRFQIDSVAVGMRCIDTGLGHILIRYCNRAIDHCAKFGRFGVENALCKLDGLRTPFDGCSSKEASEDIMHNAVRVRLLEFVLGYQ